SPDFSAARHHGRAYDLQFNLMHTRRSGRRRTPLPTLYRARRNHVFQRTSQQKSSILRNRTVRLEMSPHPKAGLWLFIIDNYLLLVIGTVLALLWANLDYGSYERVARTLHFPVNDIGMAFFFALAT